MTAALYYVLLPFAAAWLVLRFLKKYARHELAEDIARLCAEKPIEKRFFRAVRRDHKGLRHLGDFETQPEAVESVYRARAEAAGKGEKAAFLVLNDKGETLEEVDAGA